MLGVRLHDLKTRLLNKLMIRRVRLLLEAGFPAIKREWGAQESTQKAPSRAACISNKLAR